ncbi:Ubiquinone biosynthesis O-methyltransferase [Planctomycetes bacterium Pan216]|uniref:Ubiquinone biosynthesis O-methyltransferase n=1 Tax=Kolteria novifilia TaxID=2527975 RepID=A0A518B3Q1_9BACT|nr:Ubiquinone biosynthesis O-methyltransferase [Planctomycetes bacterium Pan216]
MNRRLRSLASSHAETPDDLRETIASRCPACFSRESQLVERFLGPEEIPWRIAACLECGQMFTNPRPRPDDWELDYPENYPPHQTATKRTRWSTRLRRTLERWVLRPGRDVEMGFLGPARHWPGLVTRRRLRPLIDPRFVPVHGEGRLLDIGCGNGHYLARMRQLGWDATGIDRSPRAIEKAHEAGETATFVTDFPGADVPAGPFDLITSWEVLEHLDRPRLALREARGLLAVDGRIMMSVPNQDGWAAKHFGPAWAGLDLPRHLSHFTAGSLVKMFELEGLRVRKVLTAPHPGWIRRSARRARELGLGWSRTIFASKHLSQLAAKRADAAKSGESLFVIASRG